MSSYTADNNQVPEMQQNLEMLKEMPFFSYFPAKAMKLLAFLAERAQVSSGDVLYEEGDDHGIAYLILSGHLTLVRQSGDETVIVQEYFEGDLLGILSLLGAMPALFTLRAASPTTVLTISRKQFSKILEQFPETTNLSLKALLKELHQWERKNIHQAGPCCLIRTGATAL
ncbi:MAG: cyclic nucleotide-binding domain-containing protein [Desulforhopalus sp.]